jgi:hypothetical protein
MVYLNFDEADQTAYFTLDEGRQYYSTAFTHYLCVLCFGDGTTAQATIDLAQVLNVVNENQRVTEVTMTTEGLNVPGSYSYYIYGQNSSSNIDPTNAAVVGLVEQGTLIVRDPQEYFEPIAGQNTIIALP